MTGIANEPDTVFDSFAKMFDACPKAVQRVREHIGDSGQLVDFWFGFSRDRHAVFYKIRIDGRTDLRFTLLEQ